MRTNNRNVRGNVRQAEYKKRKQLKSRLFLLIGVVLWVTLAFHIKDINTQIEEILSTLERIEILQHEAVVISADGTSAMKQNGESDYVGSIEIMNIEKPVQRTKAEAVQYLREVEIDNSLIMEIVNNSSLYPDKMLIALANNPEMAGFVAGYLNQQSSIAGSLTEAEKNESFPLFLQWDPRWGYEKYGSDSTVGISGCGPTCMSMILFYLTRDELLTPDRIAAYAMTNGYYVEGTGTEWALMEELPQLYGIQVTKPRVSENGIKSALDKGRIVICSMSEGDFTVSGHFIVIYGYDSEGFKVNDPNCVARSRKRWSFDELEAQIKGIWAYEE